MTSVRDRKLRVCMLVPGGVDRTGTERVIPCLLALIERLSREVDLHVIATRQQDDDETYALLGAHVHCVPRGQRTAPFRALLRAHRHAPFDVVHAIWMSPQGTTAAFARLAFRLPVLLHLNGGDLAALPDIGFGGRTQLPGRIRLRFAVRHAARVTVPSAAMLAAARALGIAAERVTLGVDLDRWPAAPPRPRCNTRAPARLLHLGSINRVKDHETLLRALVLLRERGTDVTLECVGVDTLNGGVERLADRLGLGDCVRFHGFVPHTRLRAFFDAADLLVVSSRYEADPIVALEAAAAGVPVVGTAVGHLQEWADDAALTCAAGDAAGLADVIAAVVRDDALRLRLAQRAQQHAVLHSAAAAADRIRSLYEELAADA